MYKNMGKVKRTLEEYVILTVATLILVVGVYVFKFPNNFSFGGVTGIAVVLSAVMPATPGNITFIHQYGAAGGRIYFPREKLWHPHRVCERADVCGAKPCGSVVSDGASADDATGTGTDVCDCAAGIQCGDHVQYRSIRRRYGYYRHDPSKSIRS